MDEPFSIPTLGRASAVDVVRVAIIGAGHMTNGVHLPLLTSFADVDVVGIADVDPGRLAATADKFGIERRYVDHRAMISDCRPDAVYAIGQPHAMFDTWVWCLEHRQHMYIEKPMGITWHQARVLAHLAELGGLITQVGYQRRTIPLLIAMRDKCRQRGPITHAVCEFYKAEPGLRLRAYDHMMDDCVHAIDTLRWLCGGDVVAIDSHCKRVGTPDLNWISAMLHFDNGSTGIVIGNWTSGRRIFRVQIHVPSAVAEVDVESHARYHANGDLVGVEYSARDIAASDDYLVFGGFHAKSREFIDSIRTGTHATSSPFADALKTMHAAETILARAVLRDSPGLPLVQHLPIESRFREVD